MAKHDATSRIERPFSVIHIPSKGKYYEGNKSSFLVRHLSYIEESILADKGLMEEEDGLKFVLDSLIVDDFDIEDLLPGDVQAISMYLYSTAYGDKVDMDVTCPHCSFEEKKPVLISQFSMKDMHEWPDGNRLMHGTLPVSKAPFSIRIPTFFEEFRFKRDHESNETHLQRMAFLLHELKQESDKEAILSMLSSLSIMDSRFLKKFIEKNTPGVNTDIVHECGECHQEYKMHISSGHNFLSLPESYVSSMMEEMYLVVKHGEGISWDSARSMSTSQRKWLLTRIQQDVKKRNEQDSQSAKSVQSRSRSFKKR